MADQRSAAVQHCAPAVRACHVDMHIHTCTYAHMHICTQAGRSAAVMTPRSCASSSSPARRVVKIDS
eukprot:scaffold27850_cov69-Phaeocystis_antarctica.AAC.1